MQKTLNSIIFLRDYVTNRYSCFVAETPDDKKKCLEIRKQVFGTELNREVDDAKYSPADKDEFDDDSIHIACRDKKTSEIIGSVRITLSHHMIKDKKLALSYRLDLFSEVLLPQTFIVSRLAVLKDHRRGPAALSLACQCYKYGLKNGGLVGLLVCEPNFFPMYRKLGYAPLGKVNHSPFGGYRLPLYLVAHDYDHMKKVKSPFFKVAKEQGFPENDKGLNWAKNFKKTTVTSEVGFKLMKDSDEIDSEDNDLEVNLFEGLSDKSRDQAIKNAIKVNCKYGDVVIAKDAGCKNFGMVSQGALEVDIGSDQNIIIGEGEVFGEISFLLNTRRSADIRAANDETEVILFSLSAVKKIDSLEDQNQFWKNLAKILARRVIDSNNRN